MSAVLLSSGGMDSFLLGQHLRSTGVHAAHVFVDVGQAYVKKELAAAAHVAASCDAPLHTVKGAGFAVFEHRETGIIPFRNAELVLNAAQYGDDVYMGVIADEINSDKSETFMRAMEAVLNESHRAQYWTQGRTFRVLAPLRDTSKTALVGQYIAAGGCVTELLRTVSCYDGGDRHCGRCSSCFKRWVALANNGVDTASMFEVSPWRYHKAQDIAGKLPGYSAQRASDIRRALATVGVEV